MNFERALSELRKAGELLTLAQLAKIFDVHTSTLERWLRLYDFPKAVPLEHRRLFRPDQVIAWTERKAAESHNMLSITEVCKRCGMHPETFHNRMKNKDGPQPVRREIGTGRWLWDAAEVDAWVRGMTGGFARPLQRRDVRASAAPPVTVRNRSKQATTKQAAAL